jgi:hypothetical protein
MKMTVISHSSQTTLLKQHIMLTNNRATANSYKKTTNLRKHPVQIAVALALGGFLSASAYAQPVTALKAENSTACDTDGITFKTPEGAFVNGVTSSNSNLPVSADLGWWNQSKGLSQGSNILLSVSEVKAPADGRSTLKLSIKAYDAAGVLITTPVKLLVETDLGRLSTGGYSQQHAALEVVTSTGHACLNLVSPTVAGESSVRVSSGAVKVQGKIDFVPDLRPMLVVGIVEGGISLTKFKKDALTPNIVATDFDETLRNFEKTTEDGDTRKTVAGRVALFVKGTVKGEYLLTAALDTDKITKQKMFRDIDPNAFYPIYGDASIKNFDAQSASRLYVRVDKDKSYLLYGDYTTAATDEASKLASYSRSLTGVKTHFENDTVKVNLWAAKDTLRAFVDEQPGKGISGPYGVRQPNAVANSEKIEILTRDRNQNSVILKRELLTRFVDYDFEPFTGKILFRKPIPSIDENLNPVSILTTYEVDEGGEKFWVGGADAKLKLGLISLGASYATDKNTISPHQVGGVNAELKLGDKTYVVAEFAKSKGTQFYNQSIESITQVSTSSSTALGGVVPNKIDQSGQASRLEIRHTDDALQARAFITKADAGFQNNNAGIASGRQEAGATLNLKLNNNLSIKADLSQTKDVLPSVTATDTPINNEFSSAKLRVTGKVNDAISIYGAYEHAVGRQSGAENIQNDISATDSKRDIASLGANYKLNENINVDISLNQAKEVGKTGGLNAQGVGWNNNAGYGLTGTDLLNPANSTYLSYVSTPINSEYTSLKVRVTGKVTEDISLYGEYERATDSTSRQRSVVGGEYRINEKSRIYARHEFENTLSGANNGINLEGRSTRTSVLGIDTEYIKDGQLFTEYRLSGAQNGFDASASVGIRNQWRLAEGLTVNTSAERQALRPIEGQKSDAVAMSLGALYSADPTYKVGGKLEYRTSRTTDQWNATAAYDRKLSNDWSAIARNLYMYTHDRWGAGGGDQKQNQFQLGVAYRDMQTNQFNGLARFEHRLDSSTADANLKDSTTSIFSLHGNYHPVRSMAINGQTAFKRVNEKFDQISSKWQGALASGRFTYDINDRFDASVIASRTWGTGASVSGIGVELGARVIDGMWLAVSYNKGKFADTELFSSNASWTGWHLRLKYLLK